MYKKGYRRFTIPFFFYSISSNKLLQVNDLRHNKKNKNTIKQVLLNRIVSLFLQWFFIGYWILKTGLDFYPGPFFFYITT
jgi:hypothetical protein